MIQRMIFASAFFMLMFGFNLSLSANGDPTTQVSALLRSANPAPRTISDIHVIREELRIKPGIYTKVSVRYFLWNASANDYKDIDYAFPIDYQGNGEKYVNSGLMDDMYSESKFLVGWHDNYIKEVSFKANDVPLPFAVSPETIVETADKQTLQGLDQMIVPGELTKEEAELEYICSTIGRKWFYTQFSIAAGETMVLDVDYLLLNSARIFANGQLKREWSHSRFYYDLSPAAHWGNGVTRDIDIEIDISDVSKIYTGDELQELFGYDYPEEVKLPIRFEEQENKLIFRSHNFDFNTAQPIYLNYLNPRALPPLAEWLPYRIPNNKYTMRASKENASYPVSNLVDMDLKTAWAVPWKEGEDITLTIKFDKPLRLGAIAMLGGYHKTAKTYFENCRPGDIEVSVQVLIPEDVFDEKTGNYVDTGKYREDTQEFYSPYDDERKVDGCVETTFDDLMACSIIKQSNIWYRFLVKELTITFRDITSGQKYNDLCATELILLSDEVFLTNRIDKGK